MRDADPAQVSQRALQRGFRQVGSLGSGSHFLEVQVIEDVYDHEAATAFGLHRGRVCVMIHCGSRGLGHQICCITSGRCSRRCPDTGSMSRTDS